MAGEAASNVGFLGEVTSADLPRFWSKGARYGVSSAAALKATVGVGDRAVSIAAGVAWGDGIESKWTSAVTVSGGTVSSGSRWDTIVVRRTWQPLSSPTGKAQIMLLAGGSSKTISGSRTTDAGVTTSDQPIALVRFTAGQTQAQEIVGLRAWTENSGLVGESVEVTQYLNDPGTRIDIGDVQYRRVVDPSTGAVSWKTADFGDLSAVGLDGTSVARLQPKGAYGAGMQFSVADSNDSIYAQKPGPSGPVTTFAVDSTGQITYGNLDWSHINGTDTGWVAKSVPSGYSGSILLRRRHDRVFLYVNVTRTGAALTNQTATFIVVPSEFLPQLAEFGTAHVEGPGYDQAVLATLDPGDGTVKLRRFDVSPGSPGGTIRLSMDWHIG